MCDICNSKDKSGLFIWMEINERVELCHTHYIELTDQCHNWSKKHPQHHPLEARVAFNVIKGRMIKK